VVRLKRNTFSLLLITITISEKNGPYTDFMGLYVLDRTKDSALAYLNKYFDSHGRIEFDEYFNPETGEVEKNYFVGPITL
jgi:hypothetical protein